MTTKVRARDLKLGDHADVNPGIPINVTGVKWTSDGRVHVDYINTATGFPGWWKFDADAMVTLTSPANPAVTGETSDGYHTFNELYDHRITLFIALCAEIAFNDQYPAGYVWRSKLHSDGSAFDGWFIMGIGTKPGDQITYHLPISRWDETNWLTERPRAPEFDGHTSADVLQRLRQFFR